MSVFKMDTNLVHAVINKGFRYSIYLEAKQLFIKRASDCLAHERKLALACNIFLMNSDLLRKF